MTVCLGERERPTCFTCRNVEMNAEGRVRCSLYAIYPLDWFAEDCDGYQQVSD